MRMSDFVVRAAINPDLAAVNKEGVIREMAASLRAAGCFRESDLDDVVRAILKRELLGSTGIGRGVAIPHTKHNSVERLIGTVAVSHAGVSFESLDGEPVQVFVLLISPQDRPGDHLAPWRTSPAVSATTTSSRGCAGHHERPDLGPAGKVRPLTHGAPAARPPFPRDCHGKLHVAAPIRFDQPPGSSHAPVRRLRVGGRSLPEQGDRVAVGRDVDGKSILDLLTLGALRGPTWR